MGFAEQEARERSRCRHDIGFNAFAIVNEARRLMSSTIKERSTVRLREHMERLRALADEIEELIDDLAKVE